MDTKIKKADFVFIGSVIAGLILFFLVFSYLNYSPSNSDSKYVSVSVDGEVVLTKPLSEDMVEKIENVGTLIIEDNTVRLEDVDCRDKICEKTGAISHVYQAIICLPNKTIVRIVGGSAEDIDGIAG